MRIVSAASAARPASFQRMAAQASGGHGVDGVLEHQDAIGDADGKRAARSALADDDGDRRHAKIRHRQQALGDRRRLTALLRADARFGPGVSIKVTTGNPNFSACRISRSALR